MKLNPPTKVVFIISIILAVLGIVASFIGAVSPYAIWIELAAFVLLFLGNTVKGM